MREMDVGREVLEQAARTFGLGAVEGARPVASGLSNDLVQLTTDRGRFCVKAMRVNAESDGFQSNVEAAYAVELAAYQRGVPCPEPVPAPDGGALARVAGRWVRVHRWVDGAPPTHERSDDAARLLAAIHAGVEVVDVPLDDEPWDEAGWADLADGAATPELVDLLQRSAPSLAELEAATSASGLQVAHVASHGDLDPKNTLVVDDRLWALDWDAAGPRPVAREAVAVALDWTPDVDGFRSALSAYERASGTTLPRDPWVLGGWVSAWGGWLVHHARDLPGTPEGREQVVDACRRLTALHAALPQYLDAL